MIRCNHCHDELDYVNYRVPVTEWGTVSLYEENGRVLEDNWSTDESEHQDGATFTCPGCSREVTLSDLIVESETEEAGAPPIWGSSTQTVTATPVRAAGEVNFTGARANALSAAGFYCPHCDAYVPCDLAEEEEAECPSCHTITKRDQIL